MQTNQNYITADHRVLSEGCESRNNHQYAIAVQDLATQWIEAYPCRMKKFTVNGEELVEVLGGIGKSRKSFILPIPWNVAKLVKNYLGLTIRLHRTAPKKMASLEEQYAESKKELPLYCCNLDWMKNGGQISWSVIATCDTLLIACQTENTL